MWARVMMGAPDPGSGLKGPKEQDSEHPREGKGVSEAES